MMRWKKFFVRAALLLGLCSPMIVLSQELAGTLNGTVKDTTGAVIPGATVSIVQQGANGTPRIVQTDGRGNYTVTNLAAGNYTVTVASKGFESYKAENVTLFVAQTRSVDAELHPGQASETLTVQENTVSVDTTSSAVEGTISGTQVRELQLNNRNFEQLVTLQPGVVSGLGDEVDFGLNSSTSVEVNGVRDTANNWTVDGAEVNDSGSNSTLLNVPSVDAIQEFTLERSSYDAGFGRSGGGQILVATKSGTNEFHGDAYEFNRNNIFNANNYFNKQTDPITPRSIERYNNFGFTVGGPVEIPKLYNRRDKFFFFWSEEWRKVTSPQTATFIVPSAAQLAGTFPGNLAPTEPGVPASCFNFDSASQTTTISPACFSKNAQAYVTNLYDKFPANTPNSAGVPEYTASYSQLNNTREDLVRGDANITEKLHFFGRAMQDETPENQPQGLFSNGNFPNVAGTDLNAPGQNVVGNLTWTISPRMVNEAEFAYTQGTITGSFNPGSIAQSPAVVSQLTNNTVYQDPYNRLPAIQFDNAGGIAGYGYGETPYFERNLDRTVFDNFSWTLGHHTLRGGATVNQLLKTENASSGFSTFTFNAFQDFLLGNALQYQQASRDTVPDLHYVNFEWFVQDDWKVTQRLTLNLGVRYSYFPSPSDVNNTLNNFDPLLFNPANAPAIDPNSGEFVAGGQVPATYVNGLIFPTGAACTNAQKIAGSSATCSPYGAHVNPDPKDNFGPRFGFAYDVLGNRKTSIRGGWGIFYDRVLNGIWEDNGFQDPPLVQQATINNTQFDHPLAGMSSVSLGPNDIVSTGSPAMQTPSYMDYNLTLQQEVMPSMVLDIAYVGTQGRHLLGERDINQPTLSARAANPTANVLAVVPYQGYASFGARNPESSSNYNSLQVALNTRDRHGLTFGIAYTWSKTLTDQSNDRDSATYDTYNPNLDYGPAELNQPETFVANYVYELPFHDKQNGLGGHLLGGWELSGITQFFSGQSQTVTQPLDPFDCVTPAGASSGCIPGTYPGGINIDLDFGAHITPRPDQVAPLHLLKTQAQWFSTGSFANAVGHFGDVQQGSFLGPGQDLWDLSAIKNIKISERTRLQFRGEFFNAFNHNSFSGITTNTGSGSYGQATSSHDPREIQLGGKFVF